MSKSKIDIVFGGSRGIGAACVERLAADGWQVAYTCVSHPGQTPSSRGYAADIRDAATVSSVFDKVAADFGGAPHAVIANAGINVPAGPMAQFSAENFSKLVDVNIIGIFNVLAEAARRVEDGGAIVAVTTSPVRRALAGTGPYTATKAAVESMVCSMALELAPRHVRVNCAAPGPVDTDLFNAGKTDETKRRMASLSLFDRIGCPNEIAELIRFLISPESSWVHGQIVQPNGGMV